MALLLLLTFAAGVTAGVAADRFGLLPTPAQAGDAVVEKPRATGPMQREATIERFADDLGLSADQRAEIEEILEGHRASMKEIWTEVRPRYRALVDSVITDIEAVLTPEQVRQYRELLEKRQREESWRRGETEDSGEDGRRNGR